jgi:hypothetical protein
MVLPADPRNQFETQRLLEAIAQPDQLIICCYPKDMHIDVANRSIRDLLGPVVKDIRRQTLVLENGTTIRLILDDDVERETRGRHNYHIIR